MGEVISIFSAKQKEKKDGKETAYVPGMFWEEIMRKNKENEERVKKERAKANRNVTRSYRLKGDK